MKKRVLFLILVALSGRGLAADLDGLPNLNQSQFRAISEDLGAAFSYKAGAPAEPMGLLGFDVGLAVTSTNLEHSDVWSIVLSDGEALNVLYVPRLYAQKGLPFDIDVGGYYLTIPNSNLESWGAEVKYAFFDGSTLMPAMAVRGAFTTMNGVDELDFETKSVDLSISKGFLMLTPYAGIGRVAVTSTPKGAAVTAGLTEESYTDTRSFIGVSFSPALFNMAFERDSVGGTASYNFKLGIAF